MSVGCSRIPLLLGLSLPSKRLRSSVWGDRAIHNISDCRPIFLVGHGTDDVGQTKITSDIVDWKRSKCGLRFAGVAVLCRDKYDRQTS